MCDTKKGTRGLLLVDWSDVVVAAGDSVPLGKATLLASLGPVRGAERPVGERRLRGVDEVGAAAEADAEGTSGSLRCLPASRGGAGRVADPFHFDRTDAVPLPLILLVEAGDDGPACLKDPTPGQVGDVERDEPVSVAERAEPAVMLDCNEGERCMPSPERPRGSM